MQQTVNLTAGAMRRIGSRGRLFLIVSQSAPADVAVTIKRGNDELESVRTAGRGFRARVPEPGFDSIELTASANTTLEVIVTESAVDFDFVTGAEVVATIAANPLPVSNDRGSPGNLLHVAGVTLADAPATAVNNLATVAAGPVIAALVAANANRRALRVTNLSGDPVAIGAAGLTWATRCIVLAAGDTWIEDRAANLAWYAITDAGLAATVGLQTIDA